MSIFGKSLLSAYHFMWRHYLMTIAALAVLMHTLKVILAYVLLRFVVLQWLWAALLDFTEHTLSPILNVGTAWAQILTIMVSLATFATIMRDKYVNYTKRYYATTCTIGWNTFLPSNDGTNRYILIMPSEVTFDLSELFGDDPSLWEKVQDAMAKSNNTYVDSTTGVTHCVMDFLVFLEEDQPEFMRRIVSKVSSVISSSNWGETAHNVKSSNRDIIEPAKCLFTFEKDAPVKTPRIWLIFPQELEMFRSFPVDFDCTPEQIEEIKREADAKLPAFLHYFPFTYFKDDFHSSSAWEINAKIAIWKKKIDPYFLILKPDWYLRIVNLQKWCKADRSILNKIGCEAPVFLPLHRKNEQKIVVEWVTTDGNQAYFLSENESPFADYFGTTPELLNSVLVSLAKIRKEFDINPMTRDSPNEVVKDLEKLVLTVNKYRHLHDKVKTFLGSQISRSSYALTVQKMMTAGGRNNNNGRRVADTPQLREAVYILFYDPKYQQTYLWITLPEFFHNNIQQLSVASSMGASHWKRKKQFLQQWKQMRDDDHFPIQKVFLPLAL
jgi:hypothetical protein